MEIVKRLTMGLKLRYGVGDFGLAVMTASLQFYMLLYYTDVVKIDPAIAGSAMLVGKLTWDMVNDVLFGYLSDKTKSRWGRRRPYLIFSAVPLALSFWLLFSLPEGMSNVVAFFAIIGTFILFDTFHTMITMAYQSMTAELTTDYNERTSLSTVRMVFSVLGYISGAAITTMLAGILRDNMGISDGAAWSRVGLIFGILAAITVLITGITVRNKPVVNDAPTTLPPIKAFINTLKNKPFMKFVIISMIMSTAFTVVTAMLPYFVIYQIDMEPSIAIIMMLMLVTLALFLVPCQKLAMSIGKHKAYAVGLVIACAALLSSFFLPNKETILIYVVAFVAGLGFSSQWVCPHSMMPDVIEYDELETCQRREGIFYGMWGMTGKVTGALGVAICGWGLKIFGYVEGVQQTAMSLLGIRLMFSVLPAVLLLICVPLLMKYPITRESHAKVLEELKKRNQGK